MADINQVISLGIGTPSDVPHFILFGLSEGVTTTNGVVSQSIGTFTLSATGTLDIAGSLSKSIGNFTLSSIGTLPIGASTVYDLGPVHLTTAIEQDITVAIELGLRMNRGARDA